MKHDGGTGLARTAQQIVDPYDHARYVNTSDEHRFLHVLGQFRLRVDGECHALCLAVASEPHTAEKT
jgi:hypothetical protein